MGPDQQNIIGRLQSTLGKMEVALSSINEAIVWTDSEGIIQWCNTPFDRLVGSSHLNILGASLLKLIPLRNHPLAIVAKERSTVQAEYEWIVKDRKTILDIYASRIGMSDGNFESIVFVFRDITQEKLAQENSKRLTEQMASATAEKLKAKEVQRAYLASLNIMSDLDREKKKLQGEIAERERIETRLQQLLVSVEQSPNAIMITDIDGKVMYVNAKFHEMTGYSEQEILNQTAQIFKLGCLSDENHKDLWVKMRSGNVWRGQYHTSRKDESRYWEQAIVSPVLDKTNKIANFLLIFQDITEQKKAEEQLQAAMEMKAEFTSTVSHELRTPLASIKGSIDIVMGKSAGPLTQDQERFLGKAKSNIDRLKRLIDDFLDLSKLESGRIELDIKPSNIGVIINDVVDIQGSVAKNKGLRLEVDLAKDLPLVPCDQDRINQVLVNLVNNAIKFTENGAITIKAQLDGEFLEVCVSDTGEGIDQQNISKLFEKFYQFGDAAKRKHGGTGLGLTICKEIILQHNGRIWVESKKEEGSRFYFTLPLHERGG